MDNHLELAAERVWARSTESQVDRVTDPGTGGHVVELIVGFELGEEVFLAPVAVMEGKHLAGLLLSITLNS